MRRPAVPFLGRLKLVLQLVLALVAFAPAVSAHACADRSCAAVAVVGEAVSDQDQPGCADCGPACANGCCHAPHPATTPELPPVPATAFQAPRLDWSQAVEPPPVDPSGPRRPPRA